MELIKMLNNKNILNENSNHTANKTEKKQMLPKIQ